MDQVYHPEVKFKDISIGSKVIQGKPLKIGVPLIHGIVQGYENHVYKSIWLKFEYVLAETLMKLWYIIPKVRYISILTKLLLLLIHNSQIIVYFQNTKIPGLFGDCFWLWVRPFLEISKGHKIWKFQKVVTISTLEYLQKKLKIGCDIPGWPLEKVRKRGSWEVPKFEGL